MKVSKAKALNQLIDMARNYRGSLFSSQFVWKLQVKSKVYKRVGIRQRGPSLKDWSQLERDIQTRKSDRKLMERSKDRPARSERKSVTQRRGKRPRQVSLWKNGPNLKLISKQATTDSFAPIYGSHNPTFGNWKTYNHNKKSKGGESAVQLLQEREVESALEKQDRSPNQSLLAYNECVHTKYHCTKYYIAHWV